MMMSLGQSAQTSHLFLQLIISARFVLESLAVIRRTTTCRRKKASRWKTRQTNRAEELEAPYWLWKKQGGETKRRSHYNPSDEQREHFRLHFLNLWRLDYRHLKTMSWDSKSREWGDILPRARLRLLPNVCVLLSTQTK